MTFRPSGCICNSNYLYGGVGVVVGGQVKKDSVLLMNSWSYCCRELGPVSADNLFIPLKKNKNSPSEKSIDSVGRKFVRWKGATVLMYVLMVVTSTASKREKRLWFIPVVCNSFNSNGNYGSCTHSSSWQHRSSGQRLFTFGSLISRTKSILQLEIQTHVHTCVCLLL